MPQNDEAEPRSMTRQEFPMTFLSRDGLLLHVTKDDDGGWTMTLSFSTPKVEKRFAKLAAKEGMDLDIYLQLLFRRFKAGLFEKPTGMKLLFLRLKTRLFKKLS
jgi:hypothetical protein